MAHTEHTAALVASIYSAAWWVRHYARGARHTHAPIAAKRREAIHALGLAVREAFNASEDFEALLTALVDALETEQRARF